MSGSYTNQFVESINADIISYTNHALDQFLGKLIDSGETNIVRMGSGTKSERMKNFELSGRRTTMARKNIGCCNGYLSITNEMI